MPAKKTVNLFYVLVLLAGCAFAITACAYGVMTVRHLNRGRMAQTSVDDRFSQLLEKQGPKIMLIELLLLGVGTVGVVALDQYTDAKGIHSRDRQLGADLVATTQESEFPSKRHETKEPSG